MFSNLFKKPTVIISVTKNKHKEPAVYLADGDTFQLTDRDIKGRLRTKINILVRGKQVDVALITGKPRISSKEEKNRTPDF